MEFAEFRNLGPAITKENFHIKKQIFQGEITKKNSISQACDFVNPALVIMIHEHVDYKMDLY